MKRFTNSASKENLITLKKKQKPLADLVNEELGIDSSLHYSGHDHDYLDDADAPSGGAVEEYDLDNASEDVHHASSHRRHSGKQEENVKRKRSREGEEEAAHASLSKNREGVKRGEPFSSSSTRLGENSGRLRRRGPLDPGLSQGKYDATPVDVDTAMEDIFGALDMADLDADGEELYDENEDVGMDSDDEDGVREEGSGSGDDTSRKRLRSDRSKKRKRVKDLTEEEYIEWLSKKQKRKRRETGGLLLASSDPQGGEEGAILEQLESLRQNQIQLIRKSTTGGEEGGKLEDGGDFPSRAEAAEEAARRGKRTEEAIKHYVMLYTRLLHVRAKLQPAICRAVGLPQYYARSLFLEGIARNAGRGSESAKRSAAKAMTEEEGAVENDSEDAEVSSQAIKEAYTAVTTELRTILAMFFQMGTDTFVNAKKKKLAAGSSNPQVPSFTQIHQLHQSIIRNANECVRFWGDKFVQANSAKLRVISQPLIKQIEGILSAKSRLRLRVQKNAAHLPILAHPDHVRACLGEPHEVSAASLSSSELDLAMAAKAKRAMAIAEGDLDQEIYNDSDFLRELVRRGGFAANQLKQQLLDLTKSPNSGKEPAKKGFHRLTKGKSVSYEPRPKLVGFLMALGYEGSGRNEVFMKSLFQ